MGEIVFSGAALEILEHMLNRCWRAIAVESLLIVGQNNNQVPAGLDHPLPFFQGLYWIREVLQVV